MSGPEVLDVARDGVWTLLLVAGPVMLVGLGVGLVVALFQALTQIQEATLTFVPKIVAMLLTMVVVLPFMVNTWVDFTNRIAEKIVNIE